METGAIILIIKKLIDEGVLTSETEVLKTVEYLKRHTLDCLYYFEDVSCTNCTNCGASEYMDCKHNYFSDLEYFLTELVNCGMPVGLTEDIISLILLDIVQYNAETLETAIAASGITILNTAETKKKQLTTIIYKSGIRKLEILQNYCKINWGQ